MKQTLNLTHQNFKPEDKDTCPKCQQHRVEILKIKNTYQNDQNLFKNRKALLDIAEKTIEELKRQIQKNEEQSKKNLQKIKATHQSQNKDVISLKADLQTTKNKVKELNQKISKKQKNQEELTLQISLLEKENKLKRIRIEELKQQLKDQEESILKSVLPEQSLIKKLQQAHIKPMKERVLLNTNQADLINQNIGLKFQIEELKRKLKQQEQISCKTINGLKKSVENYQSFKVNDYKNSVNRPLKLKRKTKVQQSSIFQTSKSENYDESYSGDIQSFRIAKQDFFIDLQKYFKALPQTEAAAFLNTLSCYAEFKLDSQEEISQIEELESPC